MNLKIFILYFLSCCFIENPFVFSENPRSSLLNQNIISRSCALNTSKDGRSAGKATHILAECKYNEKAKEYFHKITWQAPIHSKTDVSSYMIVVTYEALIQSCFRVPETTFEFILNRTSGFKKNKKMRFGVIPQPIVRTGGKFTKPLESSPACPSKLKIKPLPNDLVYSGSNYTFKCKFFQNPVQDVVIQWFFTLDSVNCSKDRKRLRNSTHISIEAKNRTLRVLSAQSEQFGCYIVKVQDFSGSVIEERGYLHLKRHEYPQRENFRLSKIILIILVLLLILVTLGVITWVCCKYNRKYFHTPTYDSVNNLKVYLSHAAEKDNDKKQMRNIARWIKSFNLDVIIDLCADFSINCEGGICRWVTNNIAMADIIMVVLTSSYLNAIKSYDEDTNNNSNDDDNTHKKVHLEYNLLSNKSYNSLKSKKMIIIAKGVKRNEFPSAFHNHVFFEFPSNLGIAKDKLDKKFKKVLSGILPEGTREVSL